MASKKENFTLGAGCISCAHNKDINLYKDMFKKSTERNEDNAEEGKEFFTECLDKQFPGISEKYMEYFADTKEYVSPNFESLMQMLLQL